MYLPVDRRVSAVRALALRSSGDTRRRQARLAGLSGVILSGLSTRVRAWRAELDGRTAVGGFHNWLADYIDEPYRVSLVLVGPRRANRKPVVFITDSRDVLIAVVKLGYNDVTRALVQYEASALAAASSALAEHAYTPSLLGAGHIGGLEALVMQPLPPMSACREVGRDELVAIVRAVSAAGQVPRRELSSVLGHLRMRPLADLVHGIDEAMAQAPVGAVHGDFHSGNVGVASDGRPVVWDWERWTDGVPLGFDLLHYNLQSWVAREGVDPRVAAERLIDNAADLLAPLDVCPALAPAVACDYLVRLAARYINDRQDQAGSRLGKVEEWLFPVLRSHRKAGL